MYEDKLNNVISTDMYIQMSKELDERKKGLNALLIDMNEEKKKENLDVSEVEIEKYVNKVLEFSEDGEINREILLKLIDKIVIENKKIKSITYNFSITNNE